MELPQKHDIDIGGYGEPREGESWCSCGWEYKNDLIGDVAFRHYLHSNQAYWTALEDFYEMHKECDMRTI